MSNALKDRLSEYAHVAASLGVDAVALVPGPNFTRAIGHSFMSHERPFLLVIPAGKPAAALVPNLELGSWARTGFDGAVFDWRRANMAGLDVTRAGITAHEIDDVVTGVLEASPFANRIRTKTGHGLGRDVHEAPYIMRGNHMALPAGTVYTNEPGLYEIGNFGVRIEDVVLITADGHKTLTQFPKDLMVLSC